MTSACAAHFRGAALAAGFASAHHIHHPALVPIHPTQRLGLASPLTLLPSAAPAASSGSSGLSSVIQPRRLEADLASPSSAGSPTSTAAADPAPTAGAAPAADAPAPAPAADPTGEPAREHAAEPAGVQPDVAGLRRSASVPASPNRSRLAGAREGLEAEMAELEELWRSVPVRSSGSFTGARAGPRPTASPAPAPVPAPVPAPAPSPATAAAAASPAAPAAGAVPASPAIDFGSPLQTLSSISIGGALQSPDVFADLASPAPSGCLPSPAAAAAPSSAPPSSAGSSRLARLARLVRRSPAASPKAASLGTAGVPAPAPTAAPTTTASSGVGAALDAVDAARCQAWDLSAEEVVAPPAAAPSASPPPAAAAPPSPAAACSPQPGSATVDIGGLASSGQPGSTSVNQPRQRRSWGPTPGSEPRRTLSEASGLSSAAEATAQRPHSALGCEPASGDSFNVFNGSAAGTPASAGSGGSAPRRLSFSFDAAMPARRPADHAAQAGGWALGLMDAGRMCVLLLAFWCHPPTITACSPPL